MILYHFDAKAILALHKEREHVRTRNFPTQDVCLRIEEYRHYRLKCRQSNDEAWPDHVENALFEGNPFLLFYPVFASSGFQELDRSTTAET